MPVSLDDTMRALRGEVERVEPQLGPEGPGWRRSQMATPEYALEIVQVNRGQIPNAPKYVPRGQLTHVELRKILSESNDPRQAARLIALRVLKGDPILHQQVAQAEPENAEANLAALRRMIQEEIQTAFKALQLGATQHAVQSTMQSPTVETAVPPKTAREWDEVEALTQDQAHDMPKTNPKPPKKQKGKPGRPPKVKAAAPGADMVALDERAAGEWSRRCAMMGVGMPELKDGHIEKRALQDLNTQWANWLRRERPPTMPPAQPVQGVDDLLDEAEGDYPL